MSTHAQVTRNFFGESTSYSSFDPAKELGVQEPIGFWDPLGLSADKDEATFKRRRAVEIKHGRIVSFPSFQFLFAGFREVAGSVMYSYLLYMADHCIANLDVVEQENQGDCKR